MARNYYRGGASRAKKIVGLGDDSLHWRIAWISCETGVSPTDLANLEPRMLWTMSRYLETKAERQNNQSRRRR